MPAQSRQTPTSTSSATSPTTATPAAPDLTGGRGNGAAASDIAPAAPETSALLEEPQLRETRAAGAERVTLTPGKTYTVTDKDMAEADPWRGIARNNGTTPERLQAFNQHITDVDVGAGVEGPYKTTELAVGAQIYIPSGQELAFAECRRTSKSYDEAVAKWGKIVAGPNAKMMDAAVARASGDVGEAYGTKGAGGKGAFYTQNAEVAGARASHKGSNGKQEYKVFWLADFWKCSVYMNDVVFQAGYKPALMGNKHYATAGTADKQPQYKTIKATEAMPGDCFQRFGGTGSDQSHNAILSTFVDIEDLGDGTEKWTYNIIGAEAERAAESEHESIIDKASGKCVGGYGSGNIIRWMRPTTKR